MRGVNKLVVEINNPESEYFEKAILFLRADKIDAPQSEISENADRLLSAVVNSRKRNWGVTFIMVLIGVIGVGMVTVGILMLLGVM